MKSYKAGNDTRKIFFDLSWDIRQNLVRPRLESEERISEMNYSTGKHKQQNLNFRSQIRSSEKLDILAGSNFLVNIKI